MKPGTEAYGEVAGSGTLLSAPPETVAPAGHRSGLVLLFGRSNVGKSTLLNRLVGRKVAIVTEVPQTTRRRVRGIRTWPDAQAVYMDTPGIHRPRYTMNRRMVADAVAALEGIDLVLVLIDGAAGLGPGDRFVIDLVAQRRVPAILVVNKTDLMAAPDVLRLLGEVGSTHAWEEIIPISAATGDNVERLESLIRPRLPEGPRLYPGGEVTDTPEQDMLAEILREKIILHTREELPHSTAVLIERCAEEAGSMHVDALVVVEKDSQKGILIGREGGMMKAVASAARRDMEDLLQARVFLQVWVKVARDWRMDERFLARLGV